jgi:FixJ family two-component response regulator
MLAETMTAIPEVPMQTVPLVSTAAQGRGPILVADADGRAGEGLSYALGRRGYDTVLVSSASDIRSALEHRTFPLVFTDLMFADISGVDVIRLVTRHQLTRVVVVSGGLNVRMTAAVFRLGVYDVLEKPVILPEVMAVAARALRSSLAMPDVHLPTAATIATAGQSVANRWAAFIVRALWAPRDPRTLHDLARDAGASCSSFCESCRLVAIRPHAARDLARAMYAGAAAARQECPPEVLLSVSDTRTLKTFLLRAGPRFAPLKELSAVRAFLATQRFVPADNAGVRALDALLAEGRCGEL